MMAGFVRSLALRSGKSALSLTSYARPQVCARRSRTHPIRMSASGTSSPSEVKGPTMVRARHILVETEEMLDAVKKQLDDGKGSFAELAGLVSTCTSKGRGGDLGWFRRNTMVKEFETAAFGNPPGSIVKVKSEFGWHLIQVEEHGLAASAITVLEYDQRFGENGTDIPDDVQRVDCRETEELEKASLPGFLNLPMGEYGRWADQFEKGELQLDKDKETIVMCHHGIRSANFCFFLSQQGFTHVRNLVGGIDAYSKKIDPSVPLY